MYAERTSPDIRSTPVDRNIPPATAQLAPKRPQADGVEVLDIHEVAAYLSVSWRTVQDWDRKGLGPTRLPLPGRLRRWQQSTVDDWLKAGCPPQDGAVSTG